MSVVSTGVAPAVGDEVLVSAASVYRCRDARWLHVEHIQRCRDERWAWITGTFTDDDSHGRVMVWLDRALVRPASLNLPTPDPPVSAGQEP